MKKILLVLALVLAMVPSMAAAPSPADCETAAVRAYDADGNGLLSKSEARVAFRDYEGGGLGAWRMLTVVWCHFVDEGRW